MKLGYFLSAIWPSTKIRINDCQRIDWNFLLGGWSCLSSLAPFARGGPRSHGSAQLKWRGITWRTLHPPTGQPEWVFWQIDKWIKFRFFKATILSWWTSTLTSEEILWELDTGPNFSVTNNSLVVIVTSHSRVSEALGLIASRIDVVRWFFFFFLRQDVTKTNVCKHNKASLQVPNYSLEQWGNLSVHSSQIKSFAPTQSCNTICVSTMRESLFFPTSALLAGMKFFGDMKREKEGTILHPHDRSGTEGRKKNPSCVSKS